MVDASAVLVFAFLAMLLLHVPVAVAIGASTLLAVAALGGVPASELVAQRMVNGLSSFPLLAIPFFVLAGVLMGRGGMAARLIDFASTLVARFPGGLSYVSTLTCMLFGSISGSAAAAVSSVGGFMIPEMTRARYGREFSVAVTTTAATTGLMIPPSNIMIVYAVVAGNVSIGAMFLAGVLPGVLIGLLVIAVCAVVSVRRGYGTGERAGLKQVLVAARRAAASLALVVLVLGGILGGVFTATEAAAVAVAYAGVLTVVFYREIRVAELPGILLSSAKVTAVVMLLISTSQAMAWVLAYENVPAAVGAALAGMSEHPWVVLLLINVLLLGVGTVMDMTPAVLIFTPIFLPVAVGLGMDPVHFGVMMIANLCIGLCTPPVGSCLFIGCSVGRTSIARTTPAMLPFFGAMLVALAVIVAWPDLSLALPRWLGR